MRYRNFVFYAIFLILAALFLTCSTDLISPYDASNTKIYLYARSVARATSDNSIEDSVGNVIKIGFSSNLPMNLDSVRFISTIQYDAATAKDSLFEVFKELTSKNNKDTLWDSITFADSGTKTITGIGYISNGKTCSDSIIATIHLKPVNHKPDLKVTGNTNIVVSQPCSLAVTFIDIDSLQAHSLMVLKSPDKNYNFVNQIFTWTPSSAYIGNDTVVFMVVDYGYPPLSDTETVVITVKDTANHPPVWQDSVITLSGSVGNAINLTLIDKCSDPDSDTLTFSLIAGTPATDSIAASIYTFTPTSGDTGVFYPKIIAKDPSGLSDTVILHITITAINTIIAPTITTNPASYTVCEGTAVTFSVTATGTKPFTYKWYKGADSAGKDSVYTISPVAAKDTGSYKVIVSNGSGSATSDLVKLAMTTYTVTFNSVSGSSVASQTVVCNSTATAPTAPIRSGYKFAGWYSDSALTASFSFSTAIIANTALYANWTPVYTVTYDGNGNIGGSVPIDANTYTNGVTVTVLDDTGSLVKTGYTFTGWNTNAAGTGTSRTPGSTFSMGSANVILYAQWILTYTVTFNSGDSTVAASPAAMSVITGKTVDSLPTAPTKTSYVFDGWYTGTKGSGTKFTASTTVSANITVYANWVIEDADGNIYTEVTIGTQTWMVENLKTTHYNDGTAIPKVTDSATWVSLTTPGYCWYKNDSSTYNSTYGILYNWYAADISIIAPAGWHVPDSTDWNTLGTYLGGDTVAGGKLKETGTTHWLSPNTGATNSSGFSALPGGYRSNDGNFGSIGIYGNWWSATEDDAFHAYLRFLIYGSYYLNRDIDYKSCGYSVRLLRD
ncbi:MAG TPA: hypothetical protein DCO75_10225 [Fibrobacteres bacterium]|nr:hypothetical protein [Fibrobacterota bacterium]